MGEPASGERTMAQGGGVLRCFIPSGTRSSELEYLHSPRPGLQGPLRKMHVNLCLTRTRGLGLPSIYVLQHQPNTI